MRQIGVLQVGRCCYPIYADKYNIIRNCIIYIDNLKVSITLDGNNLSCYVEIKKYKPGGKQSSTDIKKYINSSIDSIKIMDEINRELVTSLNPDKNDNIEKNVSWIKKKRAELKTIYNNGRIIHYYQTIHMKRVCFTLIPNYSTNIEGHFFIWFKIDGNLPIKHSQIDSDIVEKKHRYVPQSAWKKLIKFIKQHR